MKASLFSEYTIDESGYNEIISDSQNFKGGMFKDPERKKDLKFAIAASLFAITFLILFRPFNIQKEITEKLLIFSCLIGCLHFLMHFSLISLVPTWSKFWRKDISRYFLISIIFLSVFAIAARLIFQQIYPTKNWEFAQWIGGSLAVYSLPYIFYYLISKRFVTTERSVRSIAEQTDSPVFESDSDFLSTMTQANFLYLKAEGNYAKIFWLSNESIKRELIQTTVKSVEESICNNNIVRCHRSYIINQTKIEKIKGNSRGYKAFISLKDNYLEVPISSGKRKDIQI